MAVRQKMTARSRDDQVAVHLAVRDRNLILGANGHSVAVHSVRTRLGDVVVESVTNIASLSPRYVNNSDVAI